MSELAFKSPDNHNPDAPAFITWPKAHLDEWIDANINPADDTITLDFEASGLHVDGMWATSAAKCEPEARVSTVAMSWLDSRSNGLMSVAIPFDQGFIGGKKGRYIGNVTKRNPVLGWETLPHTDECQARTDALAYPEHPDKCVCAPWNFGAEDWRQFCDFLESDRITRINFFNAKYDLWILLAGLRPTS